MSLARKARRQNAARMAQRKTHQPDTGALDAAIAANRLDEALRLVETLLQRHPAHPILLAQAGGINLQLGETQAALAYLQRAAQAAPDHAAIRSNLGVCYKRLGRLDLAANAYAEAMACDPHDPDLPYNMANLLLEQGQRDAAIQQFARAIELRPDHPEAMINLGSALLDGGHLAEAQEVLRLAVRLAPDNLQAIVNLSVVCDFGAYRAFDHRATLPATPNRPMLPGLSLHFEDAPLAQLDRSRAYAAATFLSPEPLAPPSPAADGRLRVGLLSADFHDHATMRLISGLLRDYDRGRFAFHALSYGPDQRDEWRAYAIAHTDSFTDFARTGDLAMAQQIRAMGLDIVVDLKGYTKGTRSHVLGARLAPLQVAWLGYPGSMGHGAVDYALVDDATVPPEWRAGFSESLVTLPHSYQANDDRRAIIPDDGTRADHGLPETGFVFASFNHTYKISPAEFDIWMRLLGAVEGSVLWLLNSNAVVEGNLRREAEARGIDPQRIIFAPPIQHNRHLGRIAHADLFLDSFAVNAHTTASDALWAGLPVLTMAGRQFAARVGASLLGAAGLPELITATPQDYEAAALALAQDPAKLGALRQRLAETRESCALFDTAGFTRHFEQALLAMHNRQQQGLPPADMAIPAHAPEVVA